MRFIVWAGAGLLAGRLLAGAHEEHFRTLDTGSEVYSNVTVTSVSATHIYFTHSRGLGSAKLQDLDPAMQQHFRYDPARAAAVASEQARDNSIYSEGLRKAAAAKRKQEIAAAKAATQPVEIPPHELHAKSFLNQPAPALMVQKWLTDPPKIEGKFVLVDIWATWCGPCQRAIPHLNELQAKYRDTLAVIGISNELPEVINRMTDPKIEYAIGSDPEARTSKALEVTAIPHLVLIDPKGIVRFQGLPQELTEQTLAGLLAKYAPDPK